VSNLDRFLIMIKNGILNIQGCKYNPYKILIYKILYIKDAKFFNNFSFLQTIYKKNV